MRPDPVPADLLPAELRIGALGFGASAAVDSCGAVRAPGLTLDWWVGADDRWHVPAEESTTRRQRPFPAPVSETMVRIPSGDAVQRAYGATAGSRAVTVVEIENRSPAPFTLALVITGRREAADRRRRCEPAARRRSRRSSLPRAPGAWAAAPSTREIVMSGAARTDAFEPTQGPIEIALLFPVPHRTTWRAALGELRRSTSRSLPDADSVARGWDVQLERGMQAALPPPIGERVDAARADLLLASADDPRWSPRSKTGDSTPKPPMVGPTSVGRIGAGPASANRSRSRGKRCSRSTHALEPAAIPLGPARGARARAQVTRSSCCPVSRPTGSASRVTVDGVPLHDGVVSFAVRWHGPRPALLWDAPAGVRAARACARSRVVVGDRGRRDACWPSRRNRCCRWARGTGRPERRSTRRVSSRDRRTRSPSTTI